jgi:hypothetical protein
MSDSSESSPSPFGFVLLGLSDNIDHDDYDYVMDDSTGSDANLDRNELSHIPEFDEALPAPVTLPDSVEAKDIPTNGIVLQTHNWDKRTKLDTTLNYRLFRDSENSGIVRNRDPASWTPGELDRFINSVTAHLNKSSLRFFVRDFLVLSNEPKYREIADIQEIYAALASDISGVIRRESLPQDAVILKHTCRNDYANDATNCLRNIIQTLKENGTQFSYNVISQSILNLPPLQRLARIDKPVSLST